MKKIITRGIAALYLFHANFVLAGSDDPFSEASSKVDEMNEMMMASGLVAGVGFCAILWGAIGLIFGKTKPEFAYRLLAAGVIFAAAGSISAWLFGN